eukprot:bmy_16923T0
MTEMKKRKKKAKFLVDDDIFSKNCLLGRISKDDLDDDSLLEHRVSKRVFKNQSTDLILCYILIHPDETVKGAIQEWVLYSKEMVEWERKRKITMGAFEDYDVYTLTIQKIE